MTSFRISYLLPLLLAFAPLAAPPAHAQDAEILRRRLRCAQLHDISEPFGQMAFQRCLQAAGNLSHSYVKPIPQDLVHPVGPLVHPMGEPSHPSDWCRQGYVWREATAGDHVCVTPDIRAQSWRENQLAPSRINLTDHSYGPDTCQGGFVWRETIPSDHVCVRPNVRDRARYDNAAAADRVAR